MKLDYSEGCAHVKGYKQSHNTPYDRRKQEEMIRKTCETGKLWHHMPSGDFWHETSKQQPAPDVLDVLYCVISDADVLNHNSYEQWASDLGYDEDSRKGEAIYQACIKQSLSLKNLIGYQAIEKLKELFQDY